MLGILGRHLNSLNDRLLALENRRPNFFCPFLLRRKEEELSDRFTQLKTDFKKHLERAAELKPVCETFSHATLCRKIFIFWFPLFANVSSWICETL